MLKLQSEWDNRCAKRYWALQNQVDAAGALTLEGLAQFAAADMTWLSALLLTYGNISVRRKDASYILPNGEAYHEPPIQ